MNTIEEKIKDGLYPSYQQLYDYYITHNHSRKETAINFNICESTVGRLIKFYQIKKDFKEINKVRNRNNVKKYGVENVSKMETVKIQKIKTCINNYGVKNPNQSLEIKEKIKQTNLQKYGVEHPAQNQEILQKMQETCLEKYGVKNPSEYEAFQQKRNENNFNKYGVKSTLSLENVQNKIQDNLLFNYGVKWGCLTKNCQNKNNGSNSKPNVYFKNLLIENNINFEREFSIDCYIYDFKIGNILIEIDPIYTHNSSVGYKNKIQPKQKDYHFQKTNKALQHGYKCIHIFDWMDYSDCIKLIQNNFNLKFRGIKGFWYNKYNNELKEYKITDDKKSMLSLGFLLLYDDGYDIQIQ